MKTIVKEIKQGGEVVGRVKVNEYTSTMNMERELGEKTVLEYANKAYANAKINAEKLRLAKEKGTVTDFVATKYKDLRTDDERKALCKWLNIDKKDMDEYVK